MAQWFVTYDDILALMPNAEQNLDQLNELMESLTQDGVTVVDQPPAQPDQDEDGEDDDAPVAELEAPSDEDIAEIEPLDFDMVNDAGYQAAMDSDDVVGLYLKEAGRVPLLTAAEELTLAKRIEAGEFAKAQIGEFGDELPPNRRL